MNYHPNYKKGQDAIEFIRIFLDSIRKETNRIKNIPEYKELDLEGKSKKTKF